MKEYPIRIQLSRKKGWRIPDNTVVVARPGKWGNPFSIAPKQAAGSKVSSMGYIAVPSIEDAIDCHHIWLLENPQGREIAEQAKRELRGKNLACWCKVGSPCHADALLEIANGDLAPAKATMSTTIMTPADGWPFPAIGE